MAKASINIQPVKAASEAHNLREQKLDYVVSDRSRFNEHWQTHSISEMDKLIKSYCRQKSGRKMQKNATPIREAVLNLDDSHDIYDVRQLCDELENRFGMKVFQIHIHRDEGHYSQEGDRSVFKGNFHAHLLFRWQDMDTGKTLRLNRKQMSQVQDVVAESLNMERGQLKSNTNRERLEAMQYKVMMREKEIEKLQHQQITLQEQNKVLEQKKNEVRNRIETIKPRVDQLRERFKSLTREDYNLRERINKTEREIRKNGGILPADD